MSDDRPAIDPARSALLVMDYQTGILGRLPDAADRDYRVYVVEDSSADPDREVHDFLIRKIFPRQAYVISIAELANLWTAQ